MTATAGPAPPLPDLDDEPATAILGWALAQFGPRLAVACSMQDAVVVDLAVRLDPTVEVFFLDTGFHFVETYLTAARLERRYGLKLVRLEPAGRPAVYDRDGCDACCASRKLAPMARYLESKAVVVGDALGLGDVVEARPALQLRLQVADRHLQQVGGGREHLLPVGPIEAAGRTGRTGGPG